MDSSLPKRVGKVANVLFGVQRHMEDETNLMRSSMNMLHDIERGQATRRTPPKHKHINASKH
eukprot:292369-Amphidinium_carterae.1